MRIPEDLRRSVLFLGLSDESPLTGGIQCLGTAFLVQHRRSIYLVTAKHVAKPLLDAPFLIRVNMLDGTAQNRHTDQEVAWYSHPDSDVDLAVSPFNYDFTGCDVKAIPSGIIANEEIANQNWVGIGDFTYTVGLFSLLQGKKRNLPVVHSGNVALMPSDERVPVRDWDTQTGIRHVEAYLVETQGLRGLSGAPVFVRPTFISPDWDLADGKSVKARLPRLDMFLLGLWHAAWDAPADTALAADRGRNITVPVGMGVVVPATKLLEILEMPELQEQRRRLAEDQ